MRELLDTKFSDGTKVFCCCGDAVNPVCRLCKEIDATQFHIESGLFVGTIRLNSNGPHLIPHSCLNEDGSLKEEFVFRGGKKVSFIRDLSDHV